MSGTATASGRATGEQARGEQARGEQARGRGGRPALGQAGEVDARILAAATALFLERGFEATRLDHVAQRARAGKASVYARHASKEALFRAVIADSVERTLASAVPVPAGLPAADRLRVVGTSIARRTLQPRVVELMRLIVAEAGRLPELAHAADRIGWEGGVRRVAAAMAGCDEPADDALARWLPLAARFIELMFVPLQMRALLGANLDRLSDDVPRQVEDAIALLAAVGPLGA